MLYLDQPVQSGLSYDRLANGTLDLLNDRLSRLSRPNFRRGEVEQTATMLVGTFPSNDYANTMNTSANAAKAIWYSMQVFLNDFPEANSSDDRVSLWTESYGGRYGPRAGAFIQRQNKRIQRDELREKAYRGINFDTLGIVAGCIDQLAEGISSVRYGSNNTYGFRYVSEADLRRASRNWPQCEKALKNCSLMSSQLDPEQIGSNSRVNGVCQAAFQVCGSYEGGLQGRSRYDIAAPAAGQ